MNIPRKTSINSLIHMFHLALNGLIPAMKLSSIPWRNGENYDEWDEISEVLFRHLVVGAIKWSLEGQKDERFYPYDEYLIDYQAQSFSLIYCYDNRNIRQERLGVFMNLAAYEDNFDTVTILPMQPTKNQKTISVPLEQVAFRYFRHNGEEFEYITAAE